MRNYPFEVEALNYGYGALEPFIDEETMRIHHDKHYAGYVEKLNAALKDYPELQDWSLEQLLFYPNDIPAPVQAAVLNNGGGVFNHEFFFGGMSPIEQQEMPETSDLMYAIEQNFGSYEGFKAAFKAEAMRVFGSGYTWLVVGSKGELKIISTKNQDTVLLGRAYPIIGLDVWEHAYYLKHQNQRAAYIDDWFKVLDLKKAEQEYLTTH